MNRKENNQQLITLIDGIRLCDEDGNNILENALQINFDSRMKYDYRIDRELTLEVTFWKNEYRPLPEEVTYSDITYVLTERQWTDDGREITCLYNYSGYVS